MMQISPFGAPVPPPPVAAPSPVIAEAPKAPELRYTITTTNEGTTVYLENNSGSITLTPLELACVMAKAGKHL